jgi:eukaryotic-like serine/threonine-protein kinase
MTLTVGSKLGPYEILSPLGAGGMGEVYRAMDTRLGREVAVKVLPGRLAASPEVRQRFEREARTISQLSHPHICALYDVGREGETEYLVMELLEGETLSARLARGALPLDQMLRIGTAIADALDKAHRRGIVHRDLKPGNVMLTKSGVKLLDFGLAKGMAPPGAANSLTALPTQQGLTQEGTILGTFQYMAPEQLEGKEADARTDIFAFGAVLYEMATGRKAFSGASQASLISAIMKEEPRPIATIEPASPAALDRVVRTCLAKDPEERWQSAADVKRELSWIGAESAPAPTPIVTAAAAARPRRAWLPWLALAALLCAGAVTLAFALRRPAPAAARRMDLSIVLPERTIQNDFFALSPDGGALAFSGIASGKSLIRIRELASSDVRALPGTESAESLFWSPDGRSIGFVARGKLRKIDVATGSIEALADAEAGRGGAWSAGGDILFAQKAAGAIYRVSASGGPVTAATTLQPGDLLHRWPQFLPGGKRFLFYVKTGAIETSGTYLATLGKPERRLVLRNGATGVFAPPATLLYGRSAALLSQRFDPDSGELSGTPETVVRPVMRAELGSFIDLFTVSQSGVLVYRAGVAERQLTWMDRKGDVVGKIGQNGVTWSADLSPDGREAVISTRAPETGVYTCSLIDIARDLSTPLLESAGMPVWMPDGQGVVYRSEGQKYEIRRRSAHGDPKDEPVGVVDAFTTPHSVSQDGRYLLYTRMGGNFDIGVKDLRSDAKPEMIVSTEFDERCPHFSPDGHWFVYTSDEPGQTEIFVRRFPVTQERWRVSTAGGQQPTWSRDGKEIFFVSLDGHFMAAAVSAAGSNLTIGPPQPLFRAPVRLNAVANQYTVSADGQRFLISLPIRDFDEDPFRVLLNWRAP